MNRLGILGCICLLFPLLLKAQQTRGDYQVLKSSGQIPEKFITTSTQKYFEEVEKNVSDEDSRPERKQKHNFLLENSFGVDNLLLSGKVLFNDPVGIYLNKVMDRVLKNDKQLRSEIEVYAIKSSYVNAFTTNNGLIFVNIGLLARLDNEAQLAYVLCHEITHYRKKHVINSYIENDNITRGRGMYRKASGEEKMLAISHYSKDKEWEADREGLDLLVQSGYDLSSLGQVFDILAYSEATVYNIPFDARQFEIGGIKFPESIVLDSVGQVLPDTADVQFGTHPGVGMRKADILQRIAKVPAAKREEYLVGKEEFEKVKRICQYELCNLYLEDYSYRTCVYHSYTLLKQNPDSKYLKTCIFKALYGLSKLSNYKDEDYDVSSDTFSSLQRGYVHEAQFLFDEMKPVELNVVAAVYGWQLLKTYPEDSLSKNMLSDLLYDMIQLHRNDLRTTSNVLADLYKKEMEKTRPLPRRKRQKPKLYYADGTPVVEKTPKRKRVVHKPHAPFIAQSFVAEEKDELFLDAFSKAVQKFKGEEDAKAALRAQLRRLRIKKRIEVSDDHTNEIAVHAPSGIDKVVFVNPFYYMIDLTKKQPVRYMAAEKIQKTFRSRITYIAEKAGLECVILNKKELGEAGVDTFNDIAALNEFIGQKYDYNTIPFQAQLTPDIQSLLDKYHTDYFCWTGFICLRKKNEFNVINLVASAILFPTLPFVLYDMTGPKYVTYYYSALYNLRTGERVHLTLEEYDQKLRRDLYNVNMYDLYHRYKNAH